MPRPINGCIPPCGVFCGGCPAYLRERRPCPGAQISQRCEQKDCRFYICSDEKGVRHCYACSEYPCQRFKRFAKNWLKYGQNLLENQERLRELGEDAFLEEWNARCL